MEKSAQEQIRAKLRAKIAEWTAEETEHWFCGSARNEGDLNDYLETLDMVVSDLKERIAYDDKPSLHRAEASTVLDELPHLKATLSKYDYQVIARMVAQAKVKSLQDTRAIILGGSHANASALEDNVIDLDCPNIMKGMRSAPKCLSSILIQLSSAVFLKLYVVSFPD
ncbi:hypothetical protein [Atlantibacter hermannii]|uniref:hypothetical protein n=1 Tax=Atlantibacter hermannii TaxID=565 RepID=UPI0019316CC8|nr:hypothetical protein [Atlantibacter hermannii]MBL7636916.1 hypothetical protein [Atlantibacter hermannii]MBL7675472.1 hypothetical protein [Atlantibacter hermannii]